MWRRATWPHLYPMASGPCWVSGGSFRNNSISTSIHNIGPRSSGKEKPSYLRLLPWALPRHHIHHQDPPENSLLLLQSDRALPPDRCHGSAGLHPSPGLWREAGPLYVLNINCFSSHLITLSGVNLLLAIVLFSTIVGEMLPVTNNSPLIGR